MKKAAVAPKTDKTLTEAARILRRLEKQGVGIHKIADDLEVSWFTVYRWQDAEEQDGKVVKGHKPHPGTLTRLKHLATTLSLSEAAAASKK